MVLLLTQVIEDSLRTVSSKTDKITREITTLKLGYNLHRFWRFYSRPVFYTFDDQFEKLSVKHSKECFIR